MPLEVAVLAVGEVRCPTGTEIGQARAELLGCRGCLQREVHRRHNALLWPSRVTYAQHARRWELQSIRSVCTPQRRTRIAAQYREITVAGRSPGVISLQRRGRRPAALSGLPEAAGV